MFGTIGRFRVKPGHEERVRALDEEWGRTIRPTVPGLVVSLWGRAADRPGEMVAVVLMADEATYRALADMPEQHAFYLRFNEVFEAEPSWEDVELNISIND